MNPALARRLDRGRAFWTSITVGQKIVIALLVVGLALGGVFFTKWVTRPTYAPLFSNLASTDASAIVDQLNTDGVKYQLEDGGQTVLVPNSQVYDLRLQMSGKGLPAGDSTGYALLDKQGITTSEFQQNVDYQRAIEGELAKTLEDIQGVNTAVVHIALPKKDVFVEDEGTPTASVLLSLTAGTTLTGQQVQAVTNLVASSIQGMSPDDVTVADSTGAVLSAAGSDTVAAGLTDGQSQIEQAYEAQLADNAQAILDRVLGPDKALVKVQAALDFSQRNSTSESYTDPKGTAPLSSTTSSEKYSGTGAAVGGVLGPENQTNATTNGTTSTTSGSSDGGSNYDKTTTTANNAVGKTVETVKDAPGAVERLTVSVVMDQKAATGVQQAQIQALVGNAVGLNASRGDAITVATLPFDTSAAKAAAAELAQEKAADAAAAQLRLIKDAAIAAAVLLALIVLLVIRMRRRRRAPVEPPEYPPLLDSMLEAQNPAPALPVSAPLALEPGPDAELEAARRREVREKVADMVSDNPDEVAAMLRGWLSEEKV